MQAPPPRDDLLAMLPLIRLTNPSRQGGTPPRGPLAANVAPSVLRVIRSRQGTAAIGLGIGMASGTALQQPGRSQMEPAPNLPPAPGLELPNRPENRESFDESSIEVEWVPGLEIPEPDGPKILIFPDISNEIEQIIINDDRNVRQETKDQLDVVRDRVLSAHPDWEHVGGGTNRKTGLEMPEIQIPGPGVAFLHPVTGKPGDSRPGSHFPDLTFRTPSGQLVHYQTVDVDRHGGPANHELRAAARINRATRDPVHLILKTWQLREIR